MINDLGEGVVIKCRPAQLIGDTITLSFVYISVTAAGRPVYQN